MVPDLGRRVTAVYFCDVLQELILVWIIEVSQAFQIELRRAGLSRPERDFPAVRVEFQVQRGQQERMMDFDSSAVIPGQKKMSAGAERKVDRKAHSP